MERESNTLAFDAAISARRIDENGFMHVAACAISKATVNPYLGREIPDWQELKLNPDAIYYGLRDPAELEKAAMTFNGLPLMQGHHDYTAETPPKEYQVGSIGTTAFFESPYLKNDIIITDAEAIKSVENGTCKQLSSSYRYRADFTSGEYDGIKYQFVMRDIRGNHVALVPQGRAGSDVVVSDGLPVEIKQKTEGVKNTMAKKEDFKRRKVNLLKVMYAKDADLGIESEEVTLANKQKAVNVIEAQVEGYDPREIGVDVDATITVDELVERLFPGVSADTKAKLKAELTELKEGGEVDDADPNFAEGVKYGEKLEKNPAERVKLDKEHEAEGMEKAMAKDDELEEKMKDPAFKEAFEMGVKYGESREKANPKRIDSDHEREGEEKYLAKDALPAMLAEAKAQAEKNVLQRVRKIDAAARECAFALGTSFNALAYDSAEDIYAKALQAKGIDPKAYPKEAYKGMVDMLSKQQSSIGAANDAALKKYSQPKGELPDYLKALSDIEIR